MPGIKADLDHDDLFTLNGFLLDRNGDGYPDDLRARIVIDCEPDAVLWGAILDLAARLGLETAGFSLPLVVHHPDDDQLPIVIRGGRSQHPQIEPSGWHGRLAVVADGTAAVRALAWLGKADRSQTPGASLPIDRLNLLQIFETNGLLADFDGDEVPDGSRLSIDLPEQLPREVGIGLAHFAARLGLESGGINLPLASDGSSQPGRVPLHLRLSSGDTARLAVVTEDGAPGLELSGDPAEAAALLNHLAHSWPEAPATASTYSVEDIVAWVRRSIAGQTPEGRAALLFTELRDQDHPTVATTIRLLSTDPAERASQAALAREALGDQVEIHGPGAVSTVFSHNWSARWEGDRILDQLTRDVLRGLDPTEPVTLTLIVSEPASIRQNLRRQAERALFDAGFRVSESTVQVLDAYKTGLCWLREIVAPAWQELEMIERIVLRYQPFAESGQNKLDMRIRWLQELFPADELLAPLFGLQPGDISLEEWDGTAVYAAEAFGADGELLDHQEFSPITYERPYIDEIPSAGTVQVSSGGIIARQGERTLVKRVPTDLDTFWNYYQGEVLPALKAHILKRTSGDPQVNDQPFFGELRIDVTLSETDEPYGIREELHSSAEALHEDIYFNTLDFVDLLGQQVNGMHLTAPGPVVPFVHLRPGAPPHARVTLSSRARSVALLEMENEPAIPVGSLDQRPLPDARVESVTSLNGEIQLRIELAGTDDRTGALLKSLAALHPATQQHPEIILTHQGRDYQLGWPPEPKRTTSRAATAPVPWGEILTERNLGGYLQRLGQYPEVTITDAFEHSYQGRPLPAIEVCSAMEAEVWSRRKLSVLKPTFLIIGRHHANEVASTTAALKLVERLTGEPEWHRLLSRVNVVILPFENPDGAALHDALQREHPKWKHHPARYNAVGFEFGEDFGNLDSIYGEARARERLWRRWLPDVVVDNHGVPSHEWAQVFAGFGSPPRFGISYWQVRALIYGIIAYIDDDRLPEQRDAALVLRDAVAHAIASDAELLDLNRRYRERYQTWAASRVPERFPADFHREMNFQMNPRPLDDSRGRRYYAGRFPRTTAVTWVSEVCDETAHGHHLELTARAHLLANRATLDLLAAATTPPERRILTSEDGTRITLGRRRPIRLGP